MAITVPEDGEERVMVLVVRGFRAVTGQEFLPGWHCGFAPHVAAELEAAGLATVATPAPAIVQAVVAEADVTTADASKPTTTKTRRK